MTDHHTPLLQPGQKIFEYEIVRILGQGGFAAVFEAEDKLLNRKVAIKQLLLNRMDKNSVTRFVQEARIAASLGHPNVVTIYGLRREESRFYIIMEHLPGGDLRKKLQRDGKLPIEEAVTMTIGICEGLAKLHEQGIIHRDIKGENILLAADGRPTVIDFGIAHVPEAVGGLNLTQAGFQPSTLLYSSPEQVLGLDVDARSDVYQIGELLYYMLMGRHYIDLTMLEEAAVTYGGSNQVRSQMKLYELLEEAICDKMPDGLKTLWREVGALAGVVEKALAKDKTRRFKDAAEFAATLKTLSINTTPLSADKPEAGGDLRDARAYNKRGQAHISTRNYEQAITEYTKAIALDSEYAEAYNNRSTAHLMMNNYGQAIIDCDQALQLAPDFVATYVNRGIAYIGLREYRRAIEDFDKALALDSDNVYAYHNRGNARMWMGNFKDAIADFSQAIVNDREFLAAYINRGVAHSELQHYDLAIADFTQALDINPDYVYAYYNRANAFRETRLYKEALADYTRVIELNPEHRYAYENRGDMHAALGNEEDAAEDYTKIITQTATVHPKRLSVARSMLMPTSPLDFLRRE